MASAAKYLLNQLLEVKALSDSAKTAEKSRVASILKISAEKFGKCYEQFCYMQTAVHTQRRRYHDHPELVVTVAEVAFVTGSANIAREIVQGYFDENPQKDQFYCRAKIMLGLIINLEAAKTNGLHSIKERKNALVEVLDAVDIAADVDLNGARYNFIIYNASVASWTIVSPFLRETRARHFVTEMNRISAALEKIEERDLSWRIKFLSAAAVCYEDDKKAKEAGDLIDKAIVHATKMLDGTLEIESTVMVDVKKYTEESEKVISATREVEDREELLNKPPKIDPDLPEGEQEEKLPELPPLEGLAADGYDILKEQLDGAQALKAIADEKMKQNTVVKIHQEDILCCLFMQRVHSFPGDAKKVQGLPAVTQSLRIKTLVNLQCMSSGAIAEKDLQPTFDAMSKELFEAPQSNEVIETILDVCRMAWKFKMDETAILFSDIAEKTSAVSPGIRVKLDLCKAIRTVVDARKQSANKELGQRLSDKQVEGFNISRHIEAMKLLERTLTMCTSRLDDCSLVEEVCVAIWNTGLPMCQSHLRDNIHHAFNLAAQALESSSSSLTKLRAQFHFELSKCEEQADFVVQAKVEGEKAIISDYGTLDEGSKSQDLDRNRSLDVLISPFVNVLHLRSNVYGSPDDVEDQVSLILQQIKESTSKKFQIEMLGKATDSMMEILNLDKPVVQEEEADGEEKVSDVDTKGVSLADLKSLINVDRGSATDFTVFTKNIQRRNIIMANIAQIAHGQRNVEIMEKASRYVLSFTWDAKDSFVRQLIDRQIDMHFILADSFVERLADLWIEPEQEDKLALAEEGLEEGSPDIPDPRVLGINSEYCTSEMNECKRLIILSLTKGIELSSSVTDQWGVQNGIIYFWNLHLPVFRNNLFKLASDDLFSFLVKALELMAALASSAPTADSIGKPSQIDGRLKASLIAGLAKLHEAREELPQGIDIASKGALDTSMSVYDRRQLCEISYRLANVQSAGGGGKGGKAPDPPKYDHPLLNVYALLAQLELPEEIVPKDQVAATSDKAIELMKVDLSTWLEAQDWEDMSQEAFDEIMEMQAECWTRLTRTKIILNDIHASQDLAERCMQLVAEDNMKEKDEKKLSPRVWRWMSVCERYFGLAIQGIIQPDGMDESLQNELSLAALRHFNIACNYALRASNEELLVNASISAWNASMHLVDSAAVRPSLLFLQREIIKALLTCRMDNEEALMLRQQFYLAMIEEQAQSHEWDAALEIVFEAFDKVPAKLQKPLWKWRVIVLSKKGKNVLDGIQKLKEGDASLQARVYGILARASSNPKQQIEAYKKTIDILKEDMERVDYTLETAQFMASAGVPRVEISEVIQSGLDALYEVEEKLLLDTGAEKSEGNENDDDRSINSSQSGTSARSKRSASKPGSTSRRSSAAPAPGSRRQSGSRRASRSSRGSKAGSIAGEAEDTSGIPTELNIKLLEQGVRSLTMMAMLSSDDDLRQERCIEAVYFVRRFFTYWEKSMQYAAKCYNYANLTAVERDETDFDDFKPSDESLAEVIIPVDDTVALLRWQPSEEFLKILSAGMNNMPQGVPSSTTLQYTPLTFHYGLYMADMLENYGFPKYALLILAWVRSILCVVPIENKEAALAVLHYRSIRMLMKCGLADLCATLPPKLGNTDVECTDFLEKFGTKLIDPAAVVLKEVVNSEQMTVFGFSSWTQALSSIDESLCGLEICYDLLKLGQFSKCRAIANITHRDLILKQDLRGVVKVTAILGELNLVVGKIDDVLAAFLSNKDDMMNVGDANILARHVRLAMKAYYRSGQYDEVRRIAADAIATLTTFSSLAINKQKDAKSGASTAGSVNTRVTTAGTRGMASSINAIVQFERSLEVTVALYDVVSEYVDFLVAESEKLAYDGKDVRSAYEEVNVRLDQVCDLAVSVSGNTTNLVATILEKKSKACTRIISKMHAYVCISSMDSAEYDKWLKDKCKIAIEKLETSVNIRRGLLSRISLEQQTYIPSVPVPNKVEEVVDDPKAKKGKGKGKGAEEEKVEEPKQESRLLSIALSRDAAFAELELAEQYLSLARLNGDQITVAPLEAEAETSIVEKYLKDTVQPIPFTSNDFDAPLVMKASHLASSAAQILDNTDYETTGSLMYATANTMRLCGAGMYDKTWRKPTPIKKEVPIEKGENAEEKEAVPTENEEEESPMHVVELDDTALDVRSNLCAQVALAIKERRFSTAIKGCATLVDAFGIIGEGATNQSACWILQMQSLLARDWLCQNWVSALNPSGDILASTLRLNELESSKYPSKETQPQINVELSFLENTSSAWRRLDVSEDPSDILSKLPDSAGVLCMQMCPNQRTLYVCAGVSVTGAEKAGPYNSSGKWCVSKMDLKEEDRRLLLNSVQQHKKWRDDVAKYVAVYGENVSPIQDQVGEESPNGGKSMKIERALEERLRALVSDMERIFTPLLGEETDIRNFLKQLLSPEDSKLSLTMIIDSSIQDLPWEGLSLGSLFNGRINRDFSLHMLGHRLNKFAPDPAVKPLCEASSIKTVFDPYGDDTGSNLEGYERESIKSITKKLIDTAPGGSKWTEVNSGSGMLSTQDWISTIQSPAPVPDAKGNVTEKKNQSLFIYTPGRLGSLLSPMEIASLNFEDVLLLLCTDQGLNDASLRRQNSLDNIKNPKDIVMETSLKIIANVSLAGCGAMVTSLWGTTLTSQKRSVQRFWDTFIQDGNNISSALANANGVAQLPEGDSLKDVGLKPWIYLARASFGIPTVSYIDV